MDWRGQAPMSGAGVSEVACRKYPWTFRKMLLETPSGFAMFDVADRLLLFPEETWTWFVNTNDAHNVVVKRSFIKIENKSAVRDVKKGPGKDLSYFIRRFSFSKPLIVPDAQLQYVIEKKLGIRCYFNADVTDELKWGINYILPEFLPHKEIVTNECSVSDQLKKKLKEYGLSVSSHTIDRDIITAAGHLYNIESISKTYSRILLCKFGHYFDGAETMSHQDLSKAVASGLRSKEIAPVDDKYSDQEIFKYINYILYEAPMKIKGIMDILQRPEVASGGSLLDSEPRSQNMFQKLSVVGLLRRYPKILILCLVFTVLLNERVLRTVGAFLS